MKLYQESRIKHDKKFSSCESGGGWNTNNFAEELKISPRTTLKRAAC